MGKMNGGSVAHSAAIMWLRRAGTPPHCTLLGARGHRHSSRGHGHSTSDRAGHPGPDGPRPAAHAATHNNAPPMSTPMPSQIRSHGLAGATGHEGLVPLVRDAVEEREGSPRSGLTRREGAREPGEGPPERDREHRVDHDVRDMPERAGRRRGRRSTARPGWLERTKIVPAQSTTDEPAHRAAGTRSARAIHRTRPRRRRVLGIGSSIVGRRVPARLFGCGRAAKGPRPAPGRRYQSQEM